MRRVGASSQSSKAMYSSLLERREGGEGGREGCRWLEGQVLQPIGKEGGREAGREGGRTYQKCSLSVLKTLRRASRGTPPPPAPR